MPLGQIKSVKLMVTEASWWIHTADVAQLKGRVHGSGNDQGYRGLTSPKLETLHFTRMTKHCCLHQIYLHTLPGNFYYYIYLELLLLQLSTHWNSRRGLYCSCLWRPTHQLLSCTANFSPLALFCL